VGGCGPVDVSGDDAGLDHGDMGRGIDLADTGHTFQRQHDPAVNRVGATGQSRPGPSGHDWHVVGPRPLQSDRDICSGPRPNDGQRCASVNQVAPVTPVALGYIGVTNDHVITKTGHQLLHRPDPDCRLNQTCRSLRWCKLSPRRCRPIHNQIVTQLSILARTSRSNTLIDHRNITR